MAQPIDPRRLRPRRRWYGVAILVAVLSIALGVGGMTVGYLSAENLSPDFRTYPGDKMSLIPMESGRRYALYVPANGPRICIVGTEKVAMPADEGFTFTRDGQKWAHVGNVQAVASASYSVKCEAPSYGFGDLPEYDQYRLRGGPGLAALLGLPCLGMTLCFAIALVTGLRRGRHKMRLQTARTATQPSPGPALADPGARLAEAGQPDNQRSAHLP